ncbi:MAG: 3'-5' exonuclease [Bacteroidota bacterium]
MALEWLTGGSTPQFWKNYLSVFEDEKEGAVKRYVVFDMETSGLDFRVDVVIALGAIGVVGPAILAGDFLEVYIQQDQFASQSIAGQSSARNYGPEKVVEAEAMIQFLNFIKDATLVGHNVNLDIEMINQALKRLDLGRIKNPYMDTNVLYQRWKDLSEDTKTTLDEVCDALKIDKSERNTASGNAYTTAVVFLKLKKKLGIN